MDTKAIIKYWIEEADEALQVAEHLFGTGDYSYSLFFGHLCIEKILKAIYVYNNRKHAPPIHNLIRLAELAKIDLSADISDKMIGPVYEEGLVSLKSYIEGLPAPDRLVEGAPVDSVQVDE